MIFLLTLWNISFKVFSYQSLRQSQGISVLESFQIFCSHLNGQPFRDLTSCTHSPLDQYEVVLGQNSIYDTDESNPARQRFDVEDWFWYDDTAKHAYYEGDIALVKIKGHAEFNENVRTICLAHPTYDYAGEEAVVAGWGSQTQGIIWSVF